MELFISRRNLLENFEEFTTPVIKPFGTHVIKNVETVINKAVPMEREAAAETGYYPLAVKGVLVDNDTSAIYLIDERYSKARKNKISLPGGHIDDDIKGFKGIDILRYSLAREFYEEFDGYDCSGANAKLDIFFKNKEVGFQGVVDMLNLLGFYNVSTTNPRTGKNQCLYYYVGPDVRVGIIFYFVFYVTPNMKKLGNQMVAYSAEEDAIIQMRMNQKGIDSLNGFYTDTTDINYEYDTRIHRRIDVISPIFNTSGIV